MTKAVTNNLAKFQELANNWESMSPAEQTEMANALDNTVKLFTKVNKQVKDKLKATAQKSGDWQNDGDKKTCVYGSSKVHLTK